MKLFSAACLLAFSTLSANAFAAKTCFVQFSNGGFIDGEKCDVPAGSRFILKTAYSACQIPVELDENCKVVSVDFNTCESSNAEVITYINKPCY